MTPAKTADTNVPPASNINRSTRLRILGQSRAQVTQLGLGGASLGDLYCKISNVQALATVERGHELGVAYFDTAPWYGCGLSETRMGLALHDKDRSSFKINSKVGRFLVPDGCFSPESLGWSGGCRNNIRFDYSGAAFLRQHEDSLQRLGVGKIDTLVIHDLEPLNFQDEAGKGSRQNARAQMEILLAESDGGFAKLVEMRDAGIIEAFGAGFNAAERGEDPVAKSDWNKWYCDQLIRRGGGGRGLDFFLLANMYSLLNYTALKTGILDAAHAAGVSVVIGGPFSSGILATGADPPDGSTPFYNYQPATDDVLKKTRRIEALCQNHGIPLVAAAIQFPLGHPAVVSVIPGAKSPAEVDSNFAMMNVEIPQQFWADLKEEGLLGAEVPIPCP